MLLLPLMFMGLPKLGLWVLTYLPMLRVALRTLRVIRLRVRATVRVFRVQQFRVLLLRLRRGQRGLRWRRSRRQLGLW